MAKICYLTGEPVLYIDCLECEKKEYCRKKKKKKLPTYYSNVNLTKKATPSGWL